MESDTIRTNPSDRPKRKTALDTRWISLTPLFRTSKKWVFDRLERQECFVFSWQLQEAQHAAARRLEHTMP